MVEKVLSFLKKNKIDLRYKTIGIGVSGGADSISLLHMLSVWQKTYQMNVFAITVDHQLRGKDSAEDTKYVEQLCKELNIPVHVERVEVKSFQKEKKISKQVASRILRYKAFEKWMDHYEADYLMLGHHGDDQIETMLMRLTTVASSEHFIGIPFSRPFSKGKIIRPLLCLTKDEIYAYCKIEQLVPREDQSNQDDAYMRNNYRNHLLPQLKQYNKNLHHTIQNMQETLIEDEEYILEQLNKDYDKIVKRDGKIFVLNIEEYMKLPPSLKRRLFKRLMTDVYQDEKMSISYIHQDSFEKLAERQSGSKKIHFPNDVIIHQSYDSIYIYQKENIEREEWIIHDGIRKIQLSEDEHLIIEDTNESTEDKNTFIYPYDEIHFPLIVRKRRPGDKMQYHGLQGSKKLKDIFIDEKIPVFMRDQYWILEDAKGKIVWLIGIKKTQNERKHTERNLRFTYKKEN